MNIVRKIRTFFRLYSDFFQNKIVRNKNFVEIQKNARFYGKPIIQNRTQSGKIEIGNNVVLNSRNLNYHVNMYAPMKLMISGKSGSIKIGDNTRIHGTLIHAYNSVIIGRNVLIAANTQIFDANRHELHFDHPELRLITSENTKPVVIEDNVWIGLNSIILPGVTIHEGAVVAAGSVVTKDVEKRTLVGGNPAKRLK
ncbi:acyltransferase [Periweissella cryptocerci]|uniref:Acyltransferase n=1 Tax=Periweissella cryptocerci TaxID=2506420 RepID=A0A4P6YWD2_9LACO|nr:acyltransferase [Periweissella cryptocerci]QBO37083.1 acyltransferase [Periweissella cryptocerci]